MRIDENHEFESNEEETGPNAEDFLFDDEVCSVEELLEFCEGCVPKDTHSDALSAVILKAGRASFSEEEHAAYLEHRENLITILNNEFLKEEFLEETYSEDDWDYSEDRNPDLEAPSVNIIVAGPFRARDGSICHWIEAHDTENKESLLPDLESLEHGSAYLTESLHSERFDLDTVRLLSSLVVDANGDYDQRLEPMFTTETCAEAIVNFLDIAGEADEMQDKSYSYIEHLVKRELRDAIRERIRLSVDVETHEGYAVLRDIESLGYPKVIMAENQLQFDGNEASVLLDIMVAMPDEHLNCYGSAELEMFTFLIQLDDIGRIKLTLEDHYYCGPEQADDIEAE